MKLFPLPTRHLFSLSAGLLTAACFFQPTPASAQAAPLHGGTFSIYLENDAFAGTDRYYTNGAKLGWSSPDLEKYSDSPYASPFLPLFNLIPFINDEQYQKNLMLTIGQNMYTPDNTEAFGPVPGDRPYAGWLYGGFGVVWKNQTVRNTLMLNVGVVGSWAYAEETQRYVHDIRDLDSPNGWDNQLRNELGVVATYNRTWRWPKVERRAGLDWELLPHAGIALGNVLTAAQLGGEFRVGLNLPDDFGTGGISPESGTSTPVEGMQQAPRARYLDFGMYAFARVDGRAVGHNIFLDGNTYANSLSVDKEIFVADISVGVAMNIKNTKISYALIYRTKEFETQVEPQVFGAISINWVY